MGSAEEIVNLSEVMWDQFLSKLKEGKIHEIVVPVLKERLVDCCSSSTTVLVLDTNKIKRFAAQGWDALKSSPFYEVLWNHRGVFSTEVLNLLQADRGIRHEMDFEAAPSIV